MWHTCSEISLLIITFNLQLLAVFIYSCSRVSANPSPTRKTSFAERQGFAEATERDLMETRCPNTLCSFANPAPQCPQLSQAHRAKQPLPQSAFRGRQPQNLI